MAANEIKLSIKVGDNGTLSIVGNEAEQAGDKLDDMSKSGNRAGKSQNSLRRSLHGTAKMTSNSTKTFAKQAQGISGGLVPAYAVLASNIFALSAAFNFLKRASDVRMLEQSQIAFAQNTGIALGALTASLREASDGMLGFKEAGQAAAIGLAKGFSPKQLEDLAVGARKASTALGRDFEDAFDRLVRGASKAEPELLDELGITLRLEEATERYAASIGSTANELNSYQRSQAVLIETQRQLNKNFGDFEATSNPFIKLSKTMEDLIKQITQSLLPIFEGLANIMTNSATAAISAFGLLAFSIAKTMIPTGGLSEKIAAIGGRAKVSFGNAWNSLKKYGGGVLEAARNTRDMQSTATKAFKSVGKEMAKLTDNKTIGKAARGQALGPLDKHNIRRAAKSAENEYRKHGEIRNGMFKGQNIEMVRSFTGSMGAMEVKGRSGFQRIGQAGKAAALTIVVAFQGAKLAVTGAMVGMQKLAAGFGKVMSKAISAAGWIGVFMLLKDMFDELQKRPADIAMAIARMMDMVNSVIFKGLNFIMPKVLWVVDQFVDAWWGVYDGVKSVFDKIAEGIAKALEAIHNTFRSAINLMIDAANEWRDEDKQIVRIPEFEATKLRGFFDDTGRAVSTLAKDFVPLIHTTDYWQTRLRESAEYQQALIKQDMAGYLDNSNKALKSYTEQNDKLLESLDQTTAGMNEEEDSLKRSNMAFNALASMNVAGQYEKIFKQRTMLIKQADGSFKKEKRYVMNDEARAKALEDLKLKLGGIAEISPKMGKALADASLDGDGGLSKLQKTINDTAVQVAFFENGITNAGIKIKDELIGGNISKAIRMLEELKQAAQDAGEGTEELTSTTGALEDYIEQFERIFGEDSEVQGSEALRVLRERYALTEAMAQGKKILGALDFEGSKLIQLNLDIEEKRAAIVYQQFLLKQTLNDEEKRKVNSLIEQLKLEEKIMQLNRARAVEGQVLSVTGSKTLASAVGDTAQREYLQQAIEQQKDLRDAAIKKGDVEGAAAATKAIQIFQKALEELEKVTLRGILADLGADFKALGPEGEYMGGMLSGLSTMVAAWELGMEQIANAGDDMSKAVQGALAMAAGMLSGLMQMQQAHTKQKVKAIDQEIDAEKKRDGKSKESLARIKALEAKKLAVQKKAFEQEKKMKIASVIINTVSAVMKAWEMFGWPMGAVLGAMIAAFGAKQVSIIQATQFQGGGDVSGDVPSTASVGKRRSTIDVAKSQSAAGELAYMRGAQGTGGPENFRGAFYGVKHRAEGGPAGYVVGEQGPELFVPQQPGTIVPNDDVAAVGGSNVTFNINTIDAMGVEDVLTQQQGNIIGMIRSAANEYGDPFLENIDTSIYSEPFAGYRRA